MNYKIGSYCINQDIYSVEGLTEFDVEDYKFAESAGMQRVFKEEKWFKSDEIDFKDIEWTPTIGSTDGKIYNITLQKEFDNNELNRAFGHIEKCLTNDFGVGSKDTEDKIFWDTDFGNVLLTKVNMFDFDFINLFFTSSIINEQSDNRSGRKQMTKFIESEHGKDLNKKGGDGFFIKTFKYIGTFLYVIFLSYSTYFIVHLICVFIMGVSWIGLFVGLLGGFFILRGFFKTIGALLSIPILYFDSHWSANFIPLSTFGIGCFISSVAYPWRMDIEYDFIKIILAVESDFLVISMFYSAFHFIGFPQKYNQ